MSLDQANILTFPAFFSEIVDNDEWNNVALIVKESTKKISHENGEKVTSEILSELSCVLNATVQKLHDKEAEDVYNAVTECFRFLRNACAIHRNVQRHLHKTTIFSVTSEILDILCRASTFQSNQSCLKTVIQFIGNAIVGNHTNQAIVWEILYPYVKQLLENGDDSLINFCCMVLYNILIGESDLALKFVSNNASLILQCYSKGSEFAMFIVEHAFAKEGLIGEIYPELEIEVRLHALDAIWAQLVERGNGEEKKVNFPLANLLYLVDQLKQRADRVLSIVEEGMTAEPREILRLLDVVACASSHSQYLSTLQTDRSLLISIACLLKNTNEIGKADEDNVFRSVQKLSEMKSANELAQDNPVFGFKASLVRLIGNLCHQHFDNQNQVRELGCLPAVLDSCNIDVYNPLLLQWSILAIRNLLENNAANQKIVAGLVAQGPGSNAILKELGMELHQDDHGSLNIAPLKRS